MRWLIKHKFHHIFFWIVYFIFWTYVSMQSYGSHFSKALLATSIYFVGQASIGYWCMYYLVPRYFFAKRYGVFAILVLCGILLGSLFIAECMTALFHSLFTKGPNPISFLTYFAYSIITVFFSTILFIAVKVISERVQTQKMQVALEKERTEHELKFLKSQINPHFLFNAINSIYVLINKDPKLAAATLARFSDMLRYQLYECNFSEVPINKEIEYLSNYIELERLRKGGTLAIDYNVNLEKDNFTLSPLLIMPFVENAFKHVSNYTDKLNFIDVSLNYQDGLFNLLIRNSVDREGIYQTQGAIGGIGQGNTKRRLNLIYPATHKLIVDQTEETYFVSLSIKVL
jgi:two-component system, LytTR family, sensor kinase